MDSDLERFHSFWIEDSNGCYLWQGGISRGYGQFRANGKTTGAHRWIFGKMYGFLPEIVMHRCDTKRCVRWDKCLEPGTYSQNLVDAYTRGLHLPRKGNSRENNISAKLTEEQVSEIRKLYASGCSQRYLGQLYNVSHTQVGRIVRGVLWK